MNAIERLRNKSDRAKVNEWLDRIGETDEACRREVIEQCETNIEARAYYISQYAEIADHT